MDPRERFADNMESVLSAIEGYAANMWTAMPVVVTKYTPSEQTVSAQPAILGKFRQADGTLKLVRMPLLLDVPVQFPSGGGFTMTFPVKPGDEGLVVFGARCINSWWANGATQNTPGDNPGVPEEVRMHDLSDGFYIPGFRSLPRMLGNLSTQSLVLRSDSIASEAVYISLNPDNSLDIIATGANGINIISNVGGVNISGDVRIVGSLKVAREVTSNLGGTHTLTQHVHPGVTAGGDETQKPIQ